VTGYIIRRLLLMIPTVFIITAITFVLMHLIPGDVIISKVGSETMLNQAQLDAIRTSLGLNRPLIVQYLDWLWKILHGNFGTSLASGLPVFNVLRAAIPVTVELVILGQLLSVCIAIPVGVISAIKQDTALDYVLRVFNIWLVAAPGFWIATLVILGMAYAFHWATPFGYATLWHDPIKNLKQFAMPAVLAGVGGSATLMRLTRSTVLEVLRQDYIRTANAKGLSQRVVLTRHVLRNALIPVVTHWGGSIGGQLGGAVITETIFGLPGVGLTLITAIQTSDITQVQMNVIFFGIVVTLINLCVDLSYTVLDRRVSYS